MNFTKKLRLNISSHSEIEFVDIIINNDTKLFIDPCLISIGQDKWSFMAQKVINNYFDRFYSIYRNKLDNSIKLKLFKHLHEINLTKLGYGNGKNGKAKTPEGMLKTFSELDKLFDKGIDLNKPIDLTLFISGFNKDCLSDMITNIILKVLMEFTLEICNKHKIATTNVTKKFFYWDTYLNDWNVYTGKCLLIENDVVLLIPKWFVHKRFYYNIDKYFSSIILEKIQEEKKWIDPQGKEVIPTKTELRKSLINKNNNILLTAINYTEQNPILLEEYHNRIPRSYLNKPIDDETLDNILYCNF